MSRRRAGGTDRLPLQPLPARLPVAGPFATDNLGARRVTFVAADNQSGRGVADDLMRPVLAKKSVDAAFVFYPVRGADFSKTLTEAGRSGAEAIIAVGTPQACEGLAMARQRLELRTPLLLPNCVGEATLSRLGGAVEGLYIGAQFLLRDPTTPTWPRTSASSSVRPVCPPQRADGGRLRLGDEYVGTLQ